MASEKHKQPASTPADCINNYNHCTVIQIKQASIAITMSPTHSVPDSNVINADSVISDESSPADHVTSVPNTTNVNTTLTTPVPPIVTQTMPQIIKSIPKTHTVTNVTLDPLLTSALNKSKTPSPTEDFLPESSNSDTPHGSPFYASQLDFSSELSMTTPSSNIVSSNHLSFDDVTSMFSQSPAVLPPASSSLGLTTAIKSEAPASISIPASTSITTTQTKLPSVTIKPLLATPITSPTVSFAHTGLTYCNVKQAVNPPKRKIPEREATKRTHYNIVLTNTNKKRSK